MAPHEADVEALLNFGAVIREEFRWRRTAPGRFRAEARLEDTYEGARVKLVGTYNHRIGNLSYSLIWGGVRIRGLDVGGPPHPNPDGQELPTPHKHRWSDEHREALAYVPTDIVSTGLEGILREFLEECGVAF